jgi:hypothetical protein
MQGIPAYLDHASFDDCPRSPGRFGASTGLAGSKEAFFCLSIDGGKQDANPICDLYAREGSRRASAC